MSVIPKRENTIYKEIESFKDYELTQCVAYEMMIRNSEFIEILNNFANADKIGLFYEKIEPFGVSYSYPLYAEYNFIPSETKKIILEMNSIIQSKNKDFVKGQWLEAFGANKYEVIEQNEGYRYYSSIEFHSKSEYKIIPFDDVILKKDTDLKNLQRIYKKLETTMKENNIKFNEWRNEEDFELLFKKDGEHLGTLLLQTIGIIKSRNIHNNKIQALKERSYLDDMFDSVIIPTPKRPRLKIPFFNVDTKIVINMSLPKHELLKYIELIKDDFDNKENSIKSTIEFLGEELEQADKIVCKTKGNCFDSRKYLSKQQKIADMFCIYDMEKADVKKTEILREIDMYHDPESKKRTGFSETTYYTYLTIARDYIDNQRYKELITGVKH